MILALANAQLPVLREAREKATTWLDPVALKLAMETVRGDRSHPTSIGLWTWRTVDGLIVQSEPHDTASDIECVGQDAAIHATLLGKCNEIEQLFTGDIAVVGTSIAVLDFLSTLPLVAHAYRHLLSCAESRLDVDVLRRIPIKRSLDIRGGPKYYGPASSDQITLATALLVALPPLCQSAQSANLARVLLTRPNLGQRAVELLTELVRRGAAPLASDINLIPTGSTL